MAFTHLGELTLGAVVPVALSATGAAVASINAQLPELQIKLASLLELSARVALVPPTIAASIQTAIALNASLVAALSVGAPAVSVDVSGLLAVMAQLSADISALTLQLQVILGIEAQLGGASVHLLRYDGTAGALVPEGIPGVSSGQDVHAIVVLGASSVSWGAIQSVFKTA